MPLPEKDYFTLDEIATRWGAPVEDIEHYGVNAKLELSVRVVADIRVEVGQEIALPDGGYADRHLKFMHIDRTVQGILPKDLDIILRNGEAAIDRFGPGEGEDYRDIDAKSPVKSITVSRDHLLVSRAERDRFEETWGIPPRAPSEDEAKPPAGDEGHIDPKAYRTGLPGRPTSIQLIMPEFRRRADVGECKSTLDAEAEALSEWLKENHPKAPPATPKTIKNNIRKQYNKLVGTNAQN